MVNEEVKKSPSNTKAEKHEALFSPRFRSVTAMAGWDEEALLMATLIVEDTPESQRNEGLRRRALLPYVLLFFILMMMTMPLQNKICLEICFEPSTTPCGHSFCRKCLRSAADKYGKKCPKCRQLISNGRCCTVNTVLWNTIQLLFPKDVEARKAAGFLNSREAEHQSPARIASHSNISRSRTDRVPALHSPESGSRDPQRMNSHVMRRQIVRPSGMSSRGGDINLRTRTGLPPSQDQDAALALRLQREEFTATLRTRRSDEQYRNSLALARSNLRAMASRAINNIRIRDRGT